VGGCCVIVRGSVWLEVVWDVIRVGACRCQVGQNTGKHVNLTQTQNTKKHLPDKTLHTHTSQQTHTKWTTFTLSSPQIRKITKIFKHTSIKISFKCNNTISQLPKPTSRTPPTTPYDRSGVYSLSCLTCNNEYVGQTSCSLTLCYKEHIRYIKHNNPQSAYTLHILSTTSMSTAL